MLRQLLVGAAVSACNIAIHALVMTAVVRVAQSAGRKDTSRRSLRLIAVMMATVSVLMAAHVCEVIVWSLAYAIDRCRTRRRRSPVFRIRELHDARLRRRNAGGALAAAGADDGDERRAAVWLVDRRHFRSAAENGETRGRGNVPMRKNGRAGDAGRSLASLMIHRSPVALPARCGAARPLQAGIDPCHSLPGC